LSLDTKKQDVHDVLHDDSYYEKEDYESLVALLRHILPIGQKYKIWKEDEDPGEALELLQDQLQAAVDEDRRALLKKGRDDLLREIRVSLEEYQNFVGRP